MDILLIEDDAEAARHIDAGLRQAGYGVEYCGDGQQGLRRAADGGHDLLIVDRMLSGLGGLEIINALRQQGSHTPVLLLSALGTIDDRIEGLRAGGDDYLIKPFAFAELLARVEVLLRRTPPPVAPHSVLRLADLEIDLVARRVTRGGRDLALSPKEFQLLEFLMRHAGQVVTRNMLLEGVWNLHFDPQTNLIDVHMSRLRQAVDRGFDQVLLHTVRGAGYVLRG
ncbi:MAG: response regulator transcription factor [Gammaproteobacteria bacterium]|nr:response regulator transcription factor [Gammaproteobacteria bacterium]